MAEAVKVVIADIKTTASELLTTVTGKGFAAPVWFRNFIFGILVIFILRHFRSVLRLPISLTTVICPLKSYCCSQSEYTLGKWLLKLILKKIFQWDLHHFNSLRFFLHQTMDNTDIWISFLYFSKLISYLQRPKIFWKTVFQVVTLQQFTVFFHLLLATVVFSKW